MPLWLRKLEGEKELKIDQEKKKKDWKLAVSDLLYTLYRELIYKYQNTYLNKGQPEESLDYIVKALESSIAKIKGFKTEEKIPGKLEPAFGELSDAFQSNIGFIKVERGKIERGETVNYFDK